MDEYKKAYMEGYAAGLEAAKLEANSVKPYFTVEDVVERYGCGLNKAREIIRAVRHVTGGGGFGMSGRVKRVELLYWESIVDKTYLYRVSAGAAK